MRPQIPITTVNLDNISGFSPLKQACETKKFSMKTPASSDVGESGETEWEKVGHKKFPLGYREGMKLEANY